MIARALFSMAVLAACNRADDPVVRKWLADWEAARTCMLSSPEYGPDGATASAVSALLEDRFCPDERLRLIAMSDTDQAKIPNWSALREEVSRLDGGPDDGPTIERIDALATGIRAAADLPAIRRSRGGSVTPLPAGRTVRLGDRELDTRMEVEFEPARVVVDHPDGFHAEISTLDDVRVVSIPRGHVLAYPSRVWAAQARGDVLTVVDVDGKEERHIQLGDSFYASKAMDSGATRAVILQAVNGAGFAIAVSTNKRKWQVHRSKESLPLDNTSQDRDTGSVDVVLHAGGSGYLYRVAQVAPFVFPVRVEIPRIKHHFECRHDGVLWAQDPGNANALHRVSPSGSRMFELTKVYPNGIADCHRTSALVLRHGLNEALDLCRGESCQTVHTTKHQKRGAAALLANGSWLYAVVIRGIVGVWREHASTPSFYRLAPADSDGELAAVTILGGTPYLAITVNGTHRFVQLPDKPS
jgi:hypothetical protein